VRSQDSLRAVHHPLEAVKPLPVGIAQRTSSSGPRNSCRFPARVKCDRTKCPRVRGRSPLHLQHNIQPSLQALAFSRSSALLLLATAWGTAVVADMTFIMLRTGELSAGRMAKATTATPFIFCYLLAPRKWRVLVVEPSSPTPCLSVSE